MPSPIGIGDTDWRRVAGTRAAQDTDGRWRVEIPYEGAMTKAEAFVALWAKGAACPISGYENLTLTARPAWTDAPGGTASAMLVFEGIKDPGATESEDEIRDERAEWGTFQAWDGVNRDSIATYEYPKTVVTFEYTSAARRTDPKNSPTITPAPTAVRIIEAVDFRWAVKAINLVEDTHYTLPSNSGASDKHIRGILHQREVGETWHVVEYHTREMQGIGVPAP